MNPSVKIPAWRIITNWLIAVVTGSVIWPLIALLYENRMDADVFLFMLVSAIASALFSLPAVVILFISHVVLNNRGTQLADHRKIHNVIHVIVAILTFAVIYFFNGTSQIRITPPMVIVPVTYTLTGLTTALITYKLYERRQSKTRPQSDSILDA